MSASVQMTERAKGADGIGRRVSPDVNASIDPSLIESDYVFERATTRHRDFTLQNYEPRPSSTRGLHSATLLRYLLRQQSLIDDVWPIVERLWDRLGHDEIVWGAKWSRTAFHSFEFYVYNWGRVGNRKKRTPSALRRSLRPLLDNHGVVDGARRYELFSFDVDVSIRRTCRVAGAHVYVPASLVQNADFFSYCVNPDGLRLENHYTTYVVRRGLSEVRQRLKLSVHERIAPPTAALLPPQLCRCFRIVYATKPGCDGMYFNRVTTKQAAWFARQFLPTTVALLLDGRSKLFEHLFWDVAFDFTAARDRRSVDLCKFGLYGFA
jgi:hypothetical protein